MRAGLQHLVVLCVALLVGDGQLACAQASANCPPKAEFDKGCGQLITQIGKQSVTWLENTLDEQLQHVVGGGRSAVGSPEAAREVKALKEALLEASHAVYCKGRRQPHQIRAAVRAATTRLKYTLRCEQERNISAIVLAKLDRQGNAACKPVKRPAGPASPASASAE